MRFFLFCATALALFAVGSAVGRRLRRLADEAYQPEPRYRYRPGMEKPDARYEAIPAAQAARTAQLVRLVSAGIPPAPTEDSVALAKAYQRLERERHGLDPETGQPSRIH